MYRREYVSANRFGKDSDRLDYHTNVNGDRRVEARP